MEHQEEIKRALLERSDNGRITCELCHQIAEELKVPLSDVGEIADKLKIKIKECQLGCFK